MTDDDVHPRMRDGETIGDYVARLERILERTETAGPLETWIWASLEREYIRQIDAAENELIGDLMQIRPAGFPPEGPFGDSLIFRAPYASPGSRFTEHLTREADRCADVLTQHLITAGVIPAGVRAEYDTTPIRPGLGAEQTLTARKVGAFLPVSDETLMDAGLLPDTRPAPARPSLRSRLARWWDGVRVRAGELVAGRQFESDW